MVNDKKLLKELDETSENWMNNKNTLDGGLLEQIFIIERGSIFFNAKDKVAIGFLPFPGNLGVYFFQITKDGRLKHTDERGIIIDDGSKAILSQAIKFCELRNNKGECADDVAIS